MNDNYQYEMPGPDGVLSEVSAESPGGFQPRLGTYLLLLFLLLIWPAANLTFLFIESPEIDWNLYDPVYFLYLPTIVMQWLIFIAVALGIYREKSSFRSIGFTRPRFADVLYAIGFLFVANISMSLIQVLLSQFGIVISQDVDAIVEKARETVWWWLALSITAAVCEETTFRGYIMTRVKGVFRKSSWALPVVLSTFAFASGHSYQGVAGLILLFIYGLLFCGLYLFTRSLWPCIFAHFIQDFSAIFLYDYVDF